MHNEWDFNKVSTAVVKAFNSVGSNMTFDSEDFVNAICGVHPKSYQDIIEFQRMKYGTYSGGHNEHWEWDRSYLSKLHISFLEHLYKRLKHA